jgi:glutamate synthase domain-containing protein 2
VIKIGQGAKPGIGGHLPGVKVTKPISETRRIPVGLDAISPAPHHDIYSIEDLGQRIAALKEATGKPVFVKVGVTNYIAYIAAGVARMGADGIIMDGQGAGTGAAPAVVRDNIGLPIEIAVPVVDQALRREGLRDGFTVVAAGRVSSAEDTAKLIALGADVVSLGTAAPYRDGLCDGPQMPPRLLPNTPHQQNRGKPSQDTLARDGDTVGRQHGLRLGRRS